MQKLFVVGASAGGIDALKAICSALPRDFPGSVLAVVHIGDSKSQLPAILSRNSALPVGFARDDELLDTPRIVIAPPDRHLLVRRENDRIRLKLSNGAKENFTRPAIDPLFRSAAAEFGSRAVGVLLSGYLNDGTVGLKAIKECGGLAVVQEPLHSPAPDMPASAIENVDVDLILDVDRIAPTLVQIAAGSIALETRAAKVEVPEWIRVENRFAENRAGLDDLRRIGVPSTYTCPECSGALFEIAHGGIRRFRCHTGHSFTADSLGKLQERAVEEALWAALRALHEQMALSTQRADEVALPASALHRSAASRAGEAASLIRELLIRKE